MATSLYDLSVPTFLQTVSAVGRLPRPRGRALRGDGRRPRRLRGRAPLRRHGAVPLPDRSGVAPCRVGAGGREDRRVRPARPGRAGPLRRPAGHDRQGGSGAGGVHPRRGQRLGGQGPRSSRSARGGSPSRRRPSSSRSRCPTSISTPSPPTTSCARGACRSASATTRAGCAPGWPSVAVRKRVCSTMMQLPNRDTRPRTL